MDRRPLVQKLQKFLCWLGLHDWSWYTEHDYQLFFHEQQMTGPLIQCRCCEDRRRMEFGTAGKIRGQKVQGIEPREYPR